jgi:two-component system NarL family response regulator
MAGELRILIVEDHAIVREGLRSILEADPGFSVVGQAGCGKEALERFRELLPDVTLLDIHFPEESGLDILKEIRAIRPSALVLMISTYDHDEDVFKAFQMGARGYILKDVERPELAAAIRAVHEGRRVIPEWAGSKLAERAQTKELTDRELEVLQLLAEGRTNKEIASVLGVSEGTIKAHLGHVFCKMGVADRTQALLAALRRGIIHIG